MEVIKTGIEGVVVIEPRIFKDERGYFFESFSQREFNEKVMPVNFVQDNESMSSYGVMRGLHFQQMPYTQSKLVRCVKGAVLDVAVDIRKGSPTYGQHVAVELTEENHLQFFIPRGFAHGFAQSFFIFLFCQLELRGPLSSTERAFSGNRSLRSCPDVISCFSFYPFNGTPIH